MQDFSENLFMCLPRRVFYFFPRYIFFFVQHDRRIEYINHSRVSGSFMLVVCSLALLYILERGSSTRRCIRVDALLYSLGPTGAVVLQRPVTVIWLV